VQVRGKGRILCSDQTFDGWLIRVLTVVDAFTRLSPAVDIRQCYRGSDVVDILECVTRQYGKSKIIRIDNGPEFISKDLDLWAYTHGLILDFSRPGKPTDNVFVESCNAKLRTGCLNTVWFLSLDEARSICKAWRQDYNEKTITKSDDRTVQSATKPRLSWLAPQGRQAWLEV